MKCPKCNQKVIVVPFLEHFYPSPIRVVFDFYCQSCDFRLGTQQQQQPYLVPDKIEEPYLTVDYEEYYFASANAERWFKRHGLTTLRKHPLNTARKITKPNY